MTWQEWTDVDTSIVDVAGVDTIVDVAGVDTRIVDVAGVDTTIVRWQEWTPQL